MSKRTPGPWHSNSVGYLYGPDGKGVVQIGVIGAHHDKEIRPFNRDRWDADAQHIIQACNAHDDQVAALQSMLEQFNEQIPGIVHDERAALIKARAALAKAEGKS